MEDFVTYDIAVKLKEKGFNVECHAYYEPLKHCLNLSRVLQTNSLAENYNCITAPTISQVLKWLREEKCLHIEIQYIFSEETIWEFEVVLIGSYERWWNESESLDSYEQAVIAGIEYVIDKLIQYYERIDRRDNEPL